MVISRYLFLFVGLGLFAGWAQAQDHRGAISAIARSGEQEILLRWAPNDPVTWKLGNRYGYTIERFTIGRGGQVDSTGQWKKVVLTQQPIKPWPLDDWKNVALDDQFAAIAAQAIYGETFEIVSPGSDAVSFINQMKEEKNRFGFALLAADHSSDAARASGLRWQDTTVTAGEEYLYRIFLAENPGRYAVDTALVTAEASTPPPLPTPPEVSVHFEDQLATIRWNGFYFNHVYVSYIVEKSEDNIHFVPVNSLPVVSSNRPNDQSQELVLLDSLAENGKPYYYRVRGITAFSESGPPSAVVSGVGVVSLQGIHPTIDTVEVLDDTAMIRWTFPKSGLAHVLGYEVVRSSSLNGDYRSLHSGLLPTDELSFTDRAPLGTNYYRVKAMGPDSTFVTSLPYLAVREDSLPPVLPESFTGKINQDGKVYLQWSSSPSEDVLGYRLYRANHPTEEFVMISSGTIADTVYLDHISVSTLTENVYYRIVAIDRRFNLSDYSPSLSLKRPDLLPPVPAQLITARAVEDGVYLQWTPSPSLDRDHYILLRWHASSAGFQKIRRFDANQKDSVFTYFDSLVTPGSDYRYILRTVDDDGLNAAYPSVQVTTLRSQPSEAAAIQADVDRYQHHVILRWEPLSDKTVSKYRIFRGLEAEPLRHYQLVSSESQFTDRQLLINHRYRYAVQAVYDDGSESPLSSVIEVEY